MKDKTKLLHERALLTCIIMLFLCIILKLFGIPWFDMETDIPTILLKIDNIIANNDVLSFLYSIIFLSINNFMILGCSTRLPYKEMALWTIKFIPLNAILIVLKLYVTSNVSMILDITFLLLMGYIINHQIKRTCIFVIINILYQGISLFIRSLGVHNGNYGICYSILLNLDYYIMFIITYSVILKGGTLCSIFHVTFSSLANQLWRKPLRASRKCLKSKEGE